MCKIFNKINNIVHYLMVLETQKIEATDDNYVKLISEEIEFYKKKLYDYCKIYANV